MIDNVKKIIPRIDPDPRRRRERRESEEEKEEARRQFEKEIEATEGSSVEGDAKLKKIKTAFQKGQASSSDETNPDDESHIIDIVV